MKTKKIILITGIRYNGDDARYAFGNTGRWFAHKLVSEDGGKTYIELPDFPTDSRLPIIRQKEWYPAIGQFVFFGNNRREVLFNMQPTDRSNLVYRIWDEDCDPKFELGKELNNGEEPEIVYDV